MSNSAFNPFEMAQAQFDKVADILDLDTGTRELLRSPIREYHFSIPVRMDDGTYHVFKGFRVQHNDARGPSKGGIPQGRKPARSEADARSVYHGRWQARAKHSGLADPARVHQGDVGALPLRQYSSAAQGDRGQEDRFCIGL